MSSSAVAVWVSVGGCRLLLLTLEVLVLLLQQLLLLLSEGRGGRCKGEKG